MDFILNLGAFLCFVCGVPWLDTKRLEMIVLDPEYTDWHMYESSIIPYWLYLRLHVLRICWLNAFDGCPVIGTELWTVPYSIRKGN